jgi:hypothetical protein
MGREGTITRRRTATLGTRILRQIGDDVPSATLTTIRPRIAVSVLLFAASIALAGCVVVPTPPPPAETTPAETPAATDGYIYEDEVVGYAVTFPGEPGVQQLVPDGSNRTVDVVSYGHPSTLALLVHGENRDDPADLRSELLGWAASVSPESVQAGSAELAGLPALRAELILPDGSEATMIVVSEGVRFFRLLAIAGTAEDRQEFFDSFELLE